MAGHNVALYHKWSQTSLHGIQINPTDKLFVSFVPLCEKKFKFLSQRHKGHKEENDAVLRNRSTLFLKCSCLFPVVSAQVFAL